MNHRFALLAPALLLESCQMSASGVEVVNARTTDLKIQYSVQSKPGVIRSNVRPGNAAMLAGVRDMGAMSTFGIVANEQVQSFPNWQGNDDVGACTPHCVILITDTAVRVSVSQQ